MHDIYDDYPLAPEKINIPKEFLSDYCLKISSIHNITTGAIKKLVLNLMNEKNYMIHWRNMQQRLELGMKIKKIHRLLKLKQSDWMRPYNDFKTQKGMISNNEAGKNFFTLMNNAAYGKTMENLRKIIKIRVVKTVKTLLNIHQELDVLIGKYLKTI